MALAIVCTVLVAVAVVVGVAAVVGVARLPDVDRRLHAADKAVVLGVMALVLAAALAGRGAPPGRALLIIVFLLLSTPVSSHAIAWAASRRRR